MRIYFLENTTPVCVDDVVSAQNDICKLKAGITCFVFAIMVWKIDTFHRKSFVLNDTLWEVGPRSPKTKIKCSKPRIFVLLNGENNFTLFLFGNGVLPFGLIVLIGEYWGEIKIVVEFWCFVSDNSSQSLVNFLKFFSQNNIPSFYFRFFQVHFPQNNDNLSIISTEIVVEEWKTHMWVSPPNRKPSGYLSSPHQNCLSLEIFTKTEKSWSELIVVSLFCWFSE